MQQQSIRKIANEYGEKEIFVAVKEFECIGAPPPHDHPHIFLDMGNSNQIICPYCATKFIFNVQPPEAKGVKKMQKSAFFQKKCEK